MHTYVFLIGAKAPSICQLHFQSIGPSSRWGIHRDMALESELPEADSF